MKLYYRIQNALDNLRARYQRFKRGYSYDDVWNMCDWFIRTVKPMLIHLKNNGISRPMEFKHRSKWEAVLEEMIDCLNFMDEDYVFKFLGFSAVDNYRNITEEDWNRLYTIMAENKNRFFKLFSEHFFDLWD